MRRWILGTMMLVAPGVASAQFDDVRPEDRPGLEAQAMGFYQALEPVVARAAASTVEVRVWRKPVGYGTVIAPGRVLSKWSDVRKASESLTCRWTDGSLLAAKVLGVYPEEDMALLEVPGLKAPPIVFGEGEAPVLGSILALARPDGEAGGVGVVSVLPRSLRESDRAYLGVQMDLRYEGAGVRVDRVEPDSGAAAAGLREGDVVLAINGNSTNGNFELGSALQRLSPGEMVKVKYLRDEVEKTVEITLGGRPSLAGIPQNRMDAMNKMGGHRYSRIVEGFASVIQTDMQIQPEDCGAPVVDLEGRVVGIALARAGRIQSFILPTAAVQALVAREPAKAGEGDLALQWNDMEPEDLQQVEPAQGGDPMERIRRHMEDMQRLLEELDGEQP